MSIAWAVAEHLHDVVRCRALFATHYHELTELASNATFAENHSVSAREHEGHIVFFHKIQRGAASRSYGVACARLAGLPEQVLGRANALLEELERGGSSTRRGPKGRLKEGGRDSQLDLFAGAPLAPREPTKSAVVARLATLDLDCMTPLEALTTLAKLKASAREESS